MYTPSQAMADAFEMNNGKPITDATSGNDPASPFVNRDPRFYADIIYNGAMFKGALLNHFQVPPETFRGFFYLVAAKRLNTHSPTFNPCILPLSIASIK